MSCKYLSVLPEEYKDSFYCLKLRISDFTCDGCPDYGDKEVLMVHNGVDSIVFEVDNRSAFTKNEDKMTNKKWERILKILNKKAENSVFNTQVGGDHYKNMRIQPSLYSEANNLTPMEHSIVKYISRHREKDGKKDLKKAIQYTEMLIELEY